MDRKCDRPYVMFHGYKVHRDGRVYGKRGRELAKEKRKRRGGGFCYCVRLFYRGRNKKWTLQRLVAACFLGPIDGYEINHIDRDPTNNHIDNLERVTPSQNQKHWRGVEKKINKRRSENDRTLRELLTKGDENEKNKVTIP